MTIFLNSSSPFQSERQRAAALVTIMNYNRIRRETVGTAAIIFFCACRMILLKMPNVPVTLGAVRVRTRAIDGRLVFFIQGWHDLALTLLPNAVQIADGALGGLLMNSLTKLGCVQHKLSNLFYATAAQKNVMYADNSTTVVLFHDQITQFRSAQEFFRRLPTRRQLGVTKRNANYKADNSPGYYVGNSTERFPSAIQASSVFSGSRRTTIRAELGEMAEAWRQQGSEEPIVRNIAGLEVTYKLP